MEFCRNLSLKILPDLWAPMEWCEENWYDIREMRGIVYHWIKQQ